MLQRTRKKDILLTAFIILGCTFIAFNNQFDMVTSNLALLGTMAIALLLFLAYRDFSINDIIVSKKKFVVLSVFIMLLYILTCVFITPEKLPRTVTPYLTIIAFYLLGILLVKRTPQTSLKLVDIDGYAPKDFTRFTLIAIFANNVWCVIPQITQVVLVFSYILFMVSGNNTVSVFCIFCDKEKSKE